MHSLYPQRIVELNLVLVLPCAVVGAPSAALHGLAVLVEGVAPHHAVRDVRQGHVGVQAAEAVVLVAVRAAFASLGDALAALIENEDVSRSERVNK